MTDQKELIQKVQNLRQIKPDKDWALFCRQNLLNKIGEEKTEIRLSAFLFNPFNLFSGLTFYPVKVTATALVVIFGVFGFVGWLSQGTFPGDALYSVKTASERAASAVVPGEGNQFKFQMKLADRRVEELSSLSNGRATVENIIPVVEEYKKEMLAAKNYLEKLAKEDVSKAVAIAEELTSQTEKHQAFLIQAFQDSPKDSQEGLKEALSYTEEANLKALTVLSSSTKENQEPSQKLREKIELKISYLENKLSDIEDENILDPVDGLIEEMKILVEEGTPDALIRALDLVKAAESYLAY